MKIVLDKGAIMPTRAHETDAGLDIYARERKLIRANSSAIFDTGVHVELPSGTVGMLKSKSGLNVKHGLTSEGVIDDIIDSFNEHCSYYVDNEDEVWKYLEYEVSSCIYHLEFIPSEEIKKFCEDLYADYWEWIYDCGKRICTRVYLWADGFYKACNQLGI